MEIKPWAKYSFELIQHAEGHFKKGSDFDKRMALISYDNSIEMCIITFLSLHPDQRKGQQFAKDDVEKWKRSYHTKIDFLEEYVRNHQKPMAIRREDIIYYHSVRNDLYHEGAKFVPPEDIILGIREVAIWVFSVIFEVDGEELLRSETNQYISESNANPKLSNETSFLEEFINMRNDMNLLLQVAGITEAQANTTIDTKQAWQLYTSGEDDTSNEIAEIVEEAERVRNTIVKGDSVSEVELNNIRKQMVSTSKTIETHLRHYQQEIVDAAIHATRRAAGPSGNKKAGIVIQVQGSGMTLTLAHYIKQVIDQKVIDDPTVLVVTDRINLNEQLYRAIRKELSNFDIPLQLPDDGLNVVESLNSGGIMVANIQKFLDASQINYRENILVVLANVLSSGKLMQLLFSAFPNATYILFANSQANIEEKTRAFGDVIYSYEIQQLRQDGYTVPFSIESRYNFKPNWSDQELVESKNHDLSEILEENIDSLAEEIVTHFESRLNLQDGIALVVVPSRQMVIRLYQEITTLRPDWHSPNDESGVVKALYTSNLSDPPEFFEHTRSRDQLAFLADQFRVIDSSLKLIITSGLWLTGIDIPSLHTIYLCKPMRGHSLMQLIAKLMIYKEGKKDAMLVDFTNSVSSTNLPF